MEELIHKEMTIEDILSRFPQKSQRLAQAITNAGLHCVGCSAATWETLEGGMEGHGYSPESILKLVEQLNGILKEKVDLETITLTSRAAKKFLELLEEEGKEGTALRFGYTPGGCKGFEYLLEYSAGSTSEDALFSCHGVEMHVRRDQLPNLLGCTIDYVDGLQGAGFKVSNPKAKSSCGCGKSQSY